MKNTEQLVNEILSPPKKKAANIPIEKLHTFNGHPFKVLDNEEMEILTESIRQQGILSPLIVRPMENKPDEYEVISGHRRLYASVKAGLTEVPALIYPLDRNEAIIAVVDSNIHREQILPSEKAFAYKMKMEAMKEQGKRTDLTLSQVATKSDTIMPFSAIRTQQENAIKNGYRQDCPKKAISAGQNRNLFVFAANLRFLRLLEN